VERAVDGADDQLVTRVLGRAEEIARSIQAEPFMKRSDILPTALDAWLHAYSDRLRGGAGVGAERVVDGVDHGGDQPD
jgi:hypothetical protein